MRDAIAELTRSLRERPDEIVVNLGAGGELLVARLRVLVIALLLLLPLINYLTDGTGYESVVGLTGAGLALLLSLLWLLLARQHRRYSWLPFVTSASDVGMVTLVLALLTLDSAPAGLNSVIVWTCYLLAILATALRNDVRVTLFTGLLAIGLYAALAGWVFAGAAAGTVLMSPDYGVVAVSTQYERLLLLLLATGLTMTMVHHTQRLVHLSGTDGLTGLPNRSFLRHRVPQIVSDARQDGAALTLALIDLDHFKHINEDHGYQVGDHALRHAVRALRGELARDEPMIRVGGEEFVVLLPLPMGAAWERMETLRRRLAATPFDPACSDGPTSADRVPVDEPCTLTLSAGMACCPHDGTDVSALMKRADLRLRAAKRGGRNRVVARDE